MSSHVMSACLPKCATREWVTDWHVPDSKAEDCCAATAAATVELDLPQVDLTSFTADKP